MISRSGAARPFAETSCALSASVQSQQAYYTSHVNLRADLTRASLAWAITMAFAFAFVFGRVRKKQKSQTLF